MIFINFKTYPEATGEKAVELANICAEVSLQTKVKIVIGLQALDIFRVASQVKISIFAQHLDPIIPKRNTGWVTALAVKKAGAEGVFLNHSEHPFLSFSDLGETIKAAKRENLETLVFVKDLISSVKVDCFKPDYIALEDPSLIETSTPMISLPKNHKLIRDFIQSINSTPLIGAGIKTKEDIFQSLKIGIKGVVLSSGFVLAADPKATLLSLASAF